MLNKHALIIDDQPSNIEVLALMLTQEGVNHTGVTSIHRVFETIDQLEHIDVIFLDLEMPQSDYRSLLHELRADIRLSNIPIIAYSVHVSEIDVVRQTGFDGFLGKPLEMNKFPDQLKRILNGESVWSY